MEKKEIEETILAAKWSIEHYEEYSTIDMELDSPYSKEDLEILEQEKRQC